MRNTLTKKGYIWLSALYNICGFIWYNNIFFFIIEQRNPQKPGWLLFGIGFAVFILNLFLSLKWDRNDKNILNTMLTGYGIYAYVSFWKYDLKLCIVIYILVGLALVIHTLFTYCRKIPRDKSKEKVLRLRMRRYYVGTKNILAMGGIFLVGILCVVKYFNLGAIEPTNVTNEGITDIEVEEYFLENIDMFLKLQPQQWETLDTNEKVDVVQTVVNYESIVLGLDKKMQVQAVKLDDSVQGMCKYNDSIIQIDIEHLNDEPESVYRTAAHEIFHVAENRYGSLYHGLSSSLQKFIFFQDAKIYAEEANNYASGTEQYDEYYMQRLECDARGYSAVAWLQMEQCIEKYLNNSKDSEGLEDPATIVMEQAKKNNVHNLDDITVHKGPLVKRKITNYGDGEVYCEEYTYDSKNRYSTIEQSSKSFNEKELTVDKIVTYSYEEYFYCVESENLFSGMKSKNVYDVHNNPIQTELVDWNEIYTTYYYYRYLCDDEDKKETVYYSRTKDVPNWEYNKEVIGFNKYGDKAYCVEQCGEDVYETTWEYNYDNEGRVIYSCEVYKDSNMLSYIITERFFGYNEKGKLIKVEENNIIKNDYTYDESKYHLRISYEYDSFDRLVKEERTRGDEDDANPEVTMIQYEYYE